MRSELPNVMLKTIFRLGFSKLQFQYSVRDFQIADNDTPMSFH